MRTEILIFGEGGFFATCAKRYFGDIAVVSSLKTTDPTDLWAEFNLYRPEVVINAAAITNTHALENDDANFRVKGAAVNIGLPLILATICQDFAARFIHLSTAAIYHLPVTSSDQRPRTEDDTPDPTVLSHYASEKMAGEKLLLSSGLLSQEPIVLRIHQPFSDLDHPKNLITKLKGFSSFLDEPSSMTSQEDCLRLIERLIFTDFAVTGLFHVLNEGTISHLEIAHKLQRHKLIPDGLLSPLPRSVMEAEDPKDPKRAKAFQPRVLATSKRLLNLGFAIRSVHEAIEETIRAQAKQLRQP